MKAAIYSRKSKLTVKGESIENQVQMCKNYASIQLKNKLITEFLIYEDEGFSGGNTNRPEFHRLIEDAKTKKYDMLICYRLDRISRNVADFSNTLKLLQTNNIDFVSIRENFDTTSPMGRAMIYIASVFAQLERETIAERIKDNMLELSKSGRWLGGVTPIGYKAYPIIYIDEKMNEKKMVKLTQVPEELKKVKLLYSKYLELKSLSKVETFALQHNIKTKRNSDFIKANIRIVLTNPVYVKATQAVLEYLQSEGITTCGDPDGEHGLLSYNKQKSIATNSGKVARVLRQKAEWIAAMSSQKGVIEANDWIEVQKILCKNKDTFPNEGKTHNALLTGILKCATCGSNMQISHGHISSKTGLKIYYYACTMKKHSKGERCNNKNAKVSEIDTAVLQQLKKICLNKKHIKMNIINESKKSRGNKMQSSKVYYINKQINENQKQIETLSDKLVLNDDISDIIISKIRRLKSELTKLKFNLQNISNIENNSKKAGLNSVCTEMFLNKNSIIDFLDINEKKELIKILINKITWDGDNSSLCIDFIGSANCNIELS